MMRADAAGLKQQLTNAREAFARSGTEANTQACERLHARILEIDPDFEGHRERMAKRKAVVEAEIAGDSLLRYCDWCSIPATDQPRIKVTGWMELPGLGRKVSIFRLCGRCAALREQYPIRLDLLPQWEDRR